MKCEEIRRFVHPFIDGEFDEREKALFEAHLADCDSCRAEVQGLMVFQEALRRKIGPPKMPTDTKERVLGRVRQQMDRVANRNRRLVPLAAVAAVLVAVVSVTLVNTLMTNPGSDVTHIVEESVAAHEASLPSEVEGTSEAIKGYLEKQEELAQQVKVDPQPPLKENESTRLLGVRLTRIGKQKALLYRYLHNGRNLSVVRLPKQLKNVAAIPMPIDPRVGNVIYNGAQDGHSVTLYDSPGYTNAVVGDITQRELIKLIPTSL